MAGSYEVEHATVSPESKCNITSNLKRLQGRGDQFSVPGIACTSQMVIRVSGVTPPTQLVHDKY